MTPVGQRRGPSHQYHVLEYRVMHGQSIVRVVRGVVQTVHVSCLFVSKFWNVRNPLPQSIRLRLSVLVRYGAGEGKINQRTYHSYTTTAR